MPRRAFRVRGLSGRIWYTSILWQDRIEKNWNGNLPNFIPQGSSDSHGDYYPACDGWVLSTMAQEELCWWCHRGSLGLATSSHTKDVMFIVSCTYQRPGHIHTTYQKCHCCGNICVIQEHNLLRTIEVRAAQCITLALKSHVQCQVRHMISNTSCFSLFAACLKSKTVKVFIFHH